MNWHTLIALAALAAAGPLHAAGAPHDHARDHAPAHGGVVHESNHQDLELVARPTLIQLYVRRLGQPADISGAGARLTLLTGTRKQEVALRPAGDRLEAAGHFAIGAGTKAVVVLTLDGQPTTARFLLP